MAIWSCSCRDCGTERVQLATASVISSSFRPKQTNCSIALKHNSRTCNYWLTPCERRLFRPADSRCWLTLWPLRASSLSGRSCRKSNAASRHLFLWFLWRIPNVELKEEKLSFDRLVINSGCVIFPPKHFLVLCFLFRALGGKITQHNFCTFKVKRLIRLTFRSTCRSLYYPESYNQIGRYSASANQE